MTHQWELIEISPLNGGLGMKDQSDKTHPGYGPFGSAGEVLKDINQPAPQEARLLTLSKPIGS